MREDMVDNMVDVARDHLPVVKIERVASSVSEMPREAPSVPKVVNLRARGMGSALARWADRQMLRRIQDTRREKDIVKD